jgi:hypothetical protein
VAYVVTDGRECPCRRSLDGPEDSAWSTLEASRIPASRVADLKLVRIMILPLVLVDANRWGTVADRPRRCMTLG